MSEGDTSNGIDVTESQDGGVIKVIKKEGKGIESPNEGAKVFVHYVGTLEDGTKFDSSRDRGKPFDFPLGRGHVIPGWEVGVETMKKGEICTLTCKPEYAYGKPGKPPMIPRDATLVFEIELLSWKDEEVTLDSLVTKKILKKGKGNDRVSDGGTVKVHLIGKDGERVFDERDVEFTVGEGSESDVIPGVDAAVKTMKKGEISLAHCDSSYAFGRQGRAEWGIEPGMPVEYEIHLKSFIQLPSSHVNDCPQAQVFCDFRPYGCTWTGLRFFLQSHLRNKASMAVHLSLLCAALSTLFPGNGHGEAGVICGASGNTNSSGVMNGVGSLSSSRFGELNRQVSTDTERILTLEAKHEQLERKYRDLIGRFEWQQAQNEASLNAVKKSVVELEARFCDGMYLWRIMGYACHLDNARENIVTALQSPPFYTSLNGYKLCLRIHPNGVDTGYGSHVSLFVHMMQSDWDDTLKWPFSGRISLSILDQSDDGENKRHISETLVTRPNLLAFQRPTTPRNHKGYGNVEFAHIETLQDRQYVKNDCLLVRVHVFQ